MDNDLDRSLRLLEDALSTPRGGLFKTPVTKLVKDQTIIDSSPSLALQGIRKNLGFNERSIYEENMSILLNDDKTVAGSVIQSSESWKNAIDSLYMEFALVLQSQSGGGDVLDIAQNLARCCSDSLKVVEGLKSKIALKNLPEEKWLENERNTWRLLFVLYQDRLGYHNLMDYSENFIPNYCGSSEKLCADNLYKKDNLIRESQLVIDWLEKNASERSNFILNNSDFTYGWEHTLHQLESPETIPIGSSTEIVPYLHPDVSHSMKLPLHHLDKTNEKQLCYRIFSEIRCGRLKEAQELAINCGHPWRAALLEGWKLYHNPNEKKLDANQSDLMEVGLEYEYEDIEGNSSRDLWKSMALKFCKKTHLNIHERAAIAALCGHLESLLSVCHTWEDYLWAHMRTLVDVRVESEIRDNIIKDYMPLSEEYWNQKMSLNEVFSHLESAKNSLVRAESEFPHHIIQKCIILDDIPKLIQYLNEWSQDSSSTTQFLRFLAHLVLFFAHAGHGSNKKAYENIIECYIKRLDDMNETELISYYVSKLGNWIQVQIYASHLEKIVDNEKRKAALIYGEDNNLDVFAITKQVVENIRSRPNDIESFSNLNRKLTTQDELKISSLDWLLFYDIQRLEALLQVNQLIFTFLTLGKLDAAQLAINKMPADSVEKILNEGENMEANQIIKDYLSYKVYLDAQEAFNEWFKQFQSKPQPPAELSQNAQFTEKVAHQHRISQYTAEIERWKLTTSHSAKSAKTLLYNVLLFPEGWLAGGKDSDYLRSICIPEVVLLLYSILHESGQYEESVQLADIIASEKHGLYKVYSKEKLGDFLEKICESSVALLNAKKDPWGKEASV